VRCRRHVRHLPGHTYIITDTGREIVDDFPLEIAIAG